MAKPELRVQGDDPAFVGTDGQIHKKSEISGRAEIVGEAFVGDDEKLMTKEGGRTEQAALARRTGIGYNSHWKYMQGDEGVTSEQIEELKLRAEAGDGHARKVLEKLRRAGLVSGSPVDKDLSAIDEMLSPGINKEIEARKPKVATTTKKTVTSGSGNLDRSSTQGSATQRSSTQGSATQGSSTQGSSTQGSSTQGRQAARKILETAADNKSIARADLKKAIFLYAGENSTVEERTAVGSKMLEFLSKKQIKLV